MIDAVIPGFERQIASIDTDGFEQEQIAVDRLGQSLYVPQVGHKGVPELLRIDIHHRSVKRNQIISRIRLHARNYTPKNAGPGPRGVAVTPDGNTVYVGLVEDGTAAHPNPTVVRVDVTQVGNEKVQSTFTVGNTPHNISIQQTLK